LEPRRRAMRDWNRAPAGYTGAENDAKGTVAG
jgi:hypothetical protein